VPDSLMLTCPLHERPLVPSPVPGGLVCPETGCLTAVRIGVPGGLFSSPLTPLGEGAAGHHELVCTYQAAGFTRTEAMQVLCCLISASIMKDKGDG
jgi:hypothetical protein